MARPPRDGERLLLGKEVAALFRVDPKTVTRWASSGRVDSIRTPSGHYRYNEQYIRGLYAALEDNGPNG